MLLKHPTPQGVVRLVMTHSLFGAVLGVAFAGALVLVDAQGIGSLLMRSESGLVAFGLLAGGFAVTFGSLAAGTAIMMLDRGDGPDDDGPGHGLRFEPVPVRVRPLRRSSSGRPLPR
jgi:hypothetical protein